MSDNGKKVRILHRPKPGILRLVAMHLIAALLTGFVLVTALSEYLSTRSVTATHVSKVR
jgi:hypothetical protein